MKAVIMAGGKGTRLQPFTASFPKPLMPLGDMPVLELLLHQLRKAGVHEVHLAVNHLHHLIRAFCGDGSRFGLDIHYSLEDSPLGTAGPLGGLLENMSDDFIVTNGDLLTTFNFHKLLESHEQQKSDATLCVYEREVKIDFGLIQVDADMNLQGYLEKPVTKHLVSMGLYVLRREAVAPHVQLGVHLDMPDLLKKMLAAGGKVRCHQQPESFWLDIGRPEDYATAQKMFEESRELFLPA
ncbi:MAG: nucleotidyltransferase family protein [Variovorax sp.]|nr:MAG: nucleotidyltransferase family protein [Variovorax sp.]